MQVAGLDAYGSTGRVRWVWAVCAYERLLLSLGVTINCLCQCSRKEEVWR